MKYTYGRAVDRSEKNVEKIKQHLPPKYIEENSYTHPNTHKRTVRNLFSEFITKNSQKKTVSDFNGKKMMIVSFLEGSPKQNLSPENCKSIGDEVAKMHELTKKLSLKRQNDLSVNSWRRLFNSVKDECSKIHKDLPR